MKNYEWIMILICIAVNSFAIDLATFEDSTSKQHSITWTLQCDDIYAGLSKSTFSINKDVAVFEGNIAIAPKLRTPGGCMIHTIFDDDHMEGELDISDTTHLILEVKSTIPYNGFRISLFGGGADGSPDDSDYKANILSTTHHDDNLDTDDDGWTTVAVSLNSFSKDWSKFTGETRNECSSSSTTRGSSGSSSSSSSNNNYYGGDLATVCMTDRVKKYINYIAIWALGVKGPFHIEIKSIRAENLDKIYDDITTEEEEEKQQHDEDDDVTIPLFKQCSNNLIKYFLIDTTKNTCGETCLNPKLNWFYKILEPKLHSSDELFLHKDEEDENNVCVGFNFDRYIETRAVERYFVGPIHLNFDVYKTSSKSEEGGDVLLPPVDIVTFGGDVDSASTWRFHEIYDTVMGGQSTGKFDVVNDIAIFEGTCSHLKTPGDAQGGFCKIETTDVEIYGKNKGIDVRKRSHIVMEVRSSIAYNGFALSFVPDSYHMFQCFKVHLGNNIPVTKNFISIAIPFDHFFTTHHHKLFGSTASSPVVTRTINYYDRHEASSSCYTDPSTCIREVQKKDFAKIEIIAEGIVGDFKLEIKSIRAANIAVGSNVAEDEIVLLLDVADRRSISGGDGEEAAVLVVVNDFVEQFSSMLRGN
jgi:hypothetical protein